ncbi:MAG: tyrosine recombinase XerC [FCB group bacterium]|nr:tyrosine recombinase XerC [FCB group bacterium]
MTDNQEGIISDFLNYLEKERGFSRHTLTAYKHDLGRFIKFMRTVREQSDFADINKNDIRMFLGHEFEAGLSSRTVARRLASIKSLFKYLVRCEAISDNPAIHVKTPKTPKTLPVYFSEKTIEAIMTAPAGDTFIGLRDRAILELFYSTGMRLSELVNLNIDDFNIYDQLVKVRGKGDKERLIPYGERAKVALNNYFHKRGIHFNTTAQAGVPLFVNTKERRLTPSAIQKRIRNYLRSVAEGEQMGPHTLRHTFATHLMDHGADIRAVKDLLGHSSLSSTQVYTHIQPDRMKKIHEQAHPHGTK